MIRRSLSAITLAPIFVLVVVQNALAAGADGATDPTKIGDNTKALVEPNAKSFWWVAAIIWLLVACFTRKSSKTQGTGLALLLAGIFIWNPAGVASGMQGIANKVI